MYAVMLSLAKSLLIKSILIISPAYFRRRVYFFEEESMESVMQQIKTAREDKKKRQADAHTHETVVDGCQVKLRFSPIGDSKIMSSIQSMLLSAHLEAALNKSAGGEPA